MSISDYDNLTESILDPSWMGSIQDQLHPCGFRRSRRAGEKTVSQSWRRLDGSEGWVLGMPWDHQKAMGHVVSAFFWMAELLAREKRGTMMD